MNTKQFCLGGSSEHGKCIYFSEIDTDSVLMNVVKQFKERSIAGQMKYGTDMDRKDLSFIEWTQHMQEELMDAILYLEKMKQEAYELEDMKNVIQVGGHIKSPTLSRKDDCIVS